MSAMVILQQKRLLKLYHTLQLDFNTNHWSAFFQSRLDSKQGQWIRVKETDENENTPLHITLFIRAKKAYFFGYKRPKNKWRRRWVKWGIETQVLKKAETSLANLKTLCLSKCKKKVKPQNPSSSKTSNQVVSTHHLTMHWMDQNIDRKNNTSIRMHVLTISPKLCLKLKLTKQTKPIPHNNLHHGEGCQHKLWCMKDCFQEHPHCCYLDLHL